MSPVRLPCPRAQHTCVLFHNVVLLFFGITNASSSSVPCRSVDMFDLINETWTCLGESVPSYQCEPIVATGQWLLLSNKNDTQMLHTYKLRMQQNDELTNGQIIKMNASNDELPIPLSTTTQTTTTTTTKDNTQLSRVSLKNFNERFSYPVINRGYDDDLFFLKNFSRSFFIILVH